MSIPPATVLIRGGRLTSLLRSATTLAAVGFPILISAPAFAGDATSPDLLKRIEELQRLIEEQQKIIAEQQERLSVVEQMILTPERQLESVSEKNNAPDGGERAARPASAPNVKKAVLVTRPMKPTSAEVAQSQSDTPVPVAPVAPDETEEEAPAPVPPVSEPETPPAPKPPAAEAPNGKPAESKLEAERPEDIEKPIDELLLDTGGVLLPDGFLQVEPLIEYAHTSSDRVNILGFTIFEAIVIGLIRVDEIERDIVRPALNFRYGLLDRLQLEAFVPAIYRSDTEILGVGTAGQTQVNIDNFDIGDVELGAAYQILSQGTWTPATVLRLRTRFPTGVSAFEIGTRQITVNEAERTVLEETPTGSGFYGIGPGTTLIWRADPVAFFGGGSYTFNLSRDQGQFGEIDPGDTIEFFAGLNVALSDRVGLNLSFVDQLIGTTEQNGVEQDGTSVNDARVSLGASYGLSPDVSILASASIGLTDESPDFLFTVSTPINFSLY